MLERMRVAISTLALVILGARTAECGTPGQPSPWEINFQPAATPIMEFIETFHFWLLVIITLISPHWPPRGSCSILANKGSGRSGFAEYCMYF